MSGVKTVTSNAYLINREGTITEVIIPRRHEENHWEKVRQLLGGDGVLVRPATQFEHTHGLIYVDEEAMWKHPINSTLTVVLDVLARFYGPAVIMKSGINGRFEKRVLSFIDKTEEYEFFKEEE